MPRAMHDKYLDVPTVRNAPDDPSSGLRHPTTVDSHCR